MPFEPFAAECPTCGSRLRVSSESLLGTISACPKCGSMVQIEAPTQDISQENNRRPQVKLGNAPVDSEAITEDGIASELADVSDVEAGNVKSGFANPPPVPNSSYLDSSLSDQDSMSGPPPTWQDNENWQSEKTQRTRHIAMIVTIALSSLSVTALTFGWFLRLQKPDPLEIAQTSEMPPAEEVEEVKEVEDAPTLVQEPDQKAEVATENLVEPIETMVKPDVTDGIGVENVVSPEANPDNQTVIPSSLIPTSPIESSDDVDTEEFGGSTMTELPAGLQQFVPQLFPEVPVEETSLKAPPTINDVEIDAAAEEDSNTLGIEPPQPINIKRDLGFKIYFNSQAYPLPSLLLLISEITGVPIQVDWTSFDLAGVDVAKPIKVIGKERTCREWLDTIAGQVDAEVREKEFVILMTVTDQAFSQAESSFLDLADFEGEAKSAEKVIEEFVGPEVEVEVEAEDERKREKETWRLLRWMSLRFVSVLN